MENEDLLKRLGIRESEIHRAYSEFRRSMPRSKRKYMISYHEFRERYIKRILKEVTTQEMEKKNKEAPLLD